MTALSFLRLKKFDKRIKTIWLVYKSHHCKRKHAYWRVYFQFGGELGIRTLAGLASSIGFQDRPLQPLG